MKSYLSFLVALFVLTASAQKNDDLISVKYLKEDFQIFRTNLETVHPGLYQYTSKVVLDSIFKHIENGLIEPISSIDFYRRLLSLMRPIGNNHTDVEPSKSYVEVLQTEALRFPFRFYFRKDSLFVLEDVSNEYVIREGALIKKINGRDAKDLVCQMANWKDTDGYNYSLPLLSVTLAFSRKYALFFGTPDSFELEYVNQNGDTKRVNIKAIKFDKLIENKKARYPSNRLKKPEDYAFEIRNNIGVLSLRNFQPEGFKASLNYLRLLKNSFKELEQQNSRHLILDLRGNGGGFPEATYKLMSYLIEETFQPIKYEYANVKKIPNPEHYEKDLFFKHFQKHKFIKDGQHYLVKNADRIKVKPKSNAFQGKIYVLIDSRCASATGEFLGHLRSQTKAIFIGEEAGGNPVTQAAGDLLHLVLPHTQLHVQIPALRAHSNVNFEDTGRGVLPDYEVLPSIEDLLSGQDAVMEWTVRHIQLH